MKCQKTALLEWRSVLEPLEKQLLQKHDKEKVYIGQEIMFTQHSGWRLRRYGSINVLKRMWTLVESGIHNELRNISYKPPLERIVYDSRRIQINGNIFVQFVIHSIGLLLALLVFIVEFHTRITLFCNPVRVIFSFLISNFLQQSQKASLLGLKCFVRRRNYHFDDYRH